MKTQVTLLNKKEIAENTMAFYFEKPAGFVFKAGQFVDVTLLNPPETDAEGNTRAYSIFQSPQADNLAIATRIRDTAFKRVLKSMPIGSNQIQIEGPMGSFNLHQNAERPAIFLSGGIGITPIKSIITDAVERNLPHAIYLFYSNRRPEDTAFLDDLSALADKNKKIRLIATMTDMASSKKMWKGETGYINKEMIEKHVPNRDGAVYYSSGPLAMVTSMRALLTSLGVSDDDIKTEEFSGY